MAMPNMSLVGVEAVPVGILILLNKFLYYLAGERMLCLYIQESTQVHMACAGQWTLKESRFGEVRCTGGPEGIEDPVFFDMGAAAYDPQ